MAELSWSRLLTAPSRKQSASKPNTEDNLAHMVELGGFTNSPDPTNAGSVYNSQLPSSNGPISFPFLLKRRGHYGKLQHVSKMCCRRRAITTYLQWALMLLGFIQFFNLTYDFFAALFPDKLDWVTDHIDRSFFPTADVQPLSCHSHNDYARRDPLLTAVRAGCTSVEADVYYRDDELYVAHTPDTIHANRTLESLYINPLLSLLESQNTYFKPGFEFKESRNGIFLTDPDQVLVLMVDFKEDSNATWDKLVEQLEPLRELDYLSYFNGTGIVERAITIVVSGDAPFARVVENSNYRFIFFDAPLDILGEATEKPASDPKLPPWADDYASGGVYDEHHHSVLDDFGSYYPLSENLHSGIAPRAVDKYPADASVYSPANSYYASVSFKRSIGYPLRSSLSRAQMDLIRRQIRGAHQRGLKVRYWGIPAWPVGVRNYIWRVLIREGVDYLNVDNIRAATQENWGPRKGGWGRKWWG